ncbi:hypothetical protein [Ahrensia sp. R2A130]|uniref:VHL beta domain-containing protein n=1 Tax=Ahrensia sp. R2A130 TaxID=744979 RepID=UPI0001E0F857|nr:hypothetical protein [Ahrensia sp. R2A130]EFL89934.1 conserved hypothetical protein [Ahrensia sp. R2A130]
MKTIIGNLNKQCMTACIFAMTALALPSVSLQPAQANTQQDTARYYNSVYKYCDAKKIAAAWNLNIDGAKALIGNKLGGPNVVGAKAIIDSAIRSASNTRCTYQDTEVTYSDAQALAGYWGRSVSAAKSKVVDIASDDGTQAVYSIIALARSNSGGGSNTTVSDASCQQLRGSRSPGTQQKTTVTFTNSSNQTRLIDWVDFNGKPVRYQTLQPGQSYQQSTYVSHVWRVTDNAGNCIQMSAARNSNDSVNIRR